MSNTSKPSAGNGRNGPWNPIDPAAVSDGDIQRTHEELVSQKEAPREGFSPVPIFLVFLTSLLIVSSSIYMVKYSGDFNQLGYDEGHRDLPWVDSGPAAPAMDPVLVAGQKTFAQCAACHQQNGQGLPGAFPPLDGSRWVTGSEERLIRIVSHGLMGPIDVKGQTYNGVMPPFAQLGDEDLAAVLTYIRQAWSNDAPPVTAARVAEVQAAVGSHGPWTAEALLAEFPLEAPASEGSSESEM